jgi:hypothetical protein
LDAEECIKIAPYDFRSHFIFGLNHLKFQDYSLVRESYIYGFKLLGRHIKSINKLHINMSTGKGTGTGDNIDNNQNNELNLLTDDDIDICIRTIIEDLNNTHETKNTLGFYSRFFLDHNNYFILDFQVSAISDLETVQHSLEKAIKAIRLITMEYQVSRHDYQKSLDTARTYGYLLDQYKDNSDQSNHIIGKNKAKVNMDIKITSSIAMNSFDVSNTC